MNIQALAEWHFPIRVYGWHRLPAMCTYCQLIGHYYCTRREILIPLRVQYWSVIMPLFVGTLFDFLFLQITDLVEVETFLQRY